jgi:hypothetical protein
MLQFETLASLSGDNEEPHAKALRRKGFLEGDDWEPIAGMMPVRFSSVFFAPSREVSPDGDAMVSPNQRISEY